MRRETVIVRRVIRRLPEPVVVPVEVEPAPLVWDERELCQAFHIGGSTVDQWRSEGMPYVKRGRVVLFIASDVLAWLQAQTIREGGPTPITARRAS